MDRIATGFVPEMKVRVREAKNARFNSGLVFHQRPSLGTFAWRGPFHVRTVLCPVGPPARDSVLIKC